MHATFGLGPNLLLYILLMSLNSFHKRVHVAVQRLKLGSSSRQVSDFHPNFRVSYVH